MNVPALKPQIDASEIAPERLANNPALTDKQKIAEASRQFESILLKQILESAQKTVIKSKFSDDNSTASSIYHGMVTTQLADSISKSGAFGLAKTFEQQLDRPEAAHPGDKNSKGISAETHSAIHTLKPLHKAGEKTFSTTSALPSFPLRGGEGEGIAGLAIQRLNVGAPTNVRLLTSAATIQRSKVHNLDSEK